MEILIMTGPPYSGKGTQCELLERQLGFKHISTGDICRNEEEKASAVGFEVAEYTKKGDLVPDPLMKALFSISLDENKKEKGIILDGYPRTIPQVDDLLDLVEQKGLKISKVLNIEVPKPELLERAKERAKTSDREDDKDPETHMKRIRVFEHSSRPAIEYMKSKIAVRTIDGLGQKEDITERIKEEL